MTIELAYEDSIAKSTICKCVNEDENIELKITVAIKITRPTPGKMAQVKH